MPKLPDVPPAILSSLPKSLCDELAVRKQRSLGSDQNAQEYRSVSDFLEDRIQHLTNDIEYIDSAHKSLNCALENSTLSAKEFRDALRPFMPPICLITKELKTLKRQRKLITEDMDEEVAIKKRQLTGPSATGLYLKAYTDSIVQRVMTACKQKTRKKFDASQFKKSVNEYYGISKERGYCQITGDFFMPRKTKAAHIVPKSLTGDEISYLFGSELVVALDPRNC